MLHGASLLAEGRQAAHGIVPPPTAFCRERGVANEAAFKTAAKERGDIMYHAHIGLADWSATERALSEVHGALGDHGYTLERYGLCLSRAMGMPADRRTDIAKETGPLLSADDWFRVANAVPVQPHLGDNMIGSPDGFANTLAALRVGATTIGNLGQYFGFDWPGYSDVELTEATVRAIGAMSELRNRGALLHSYLDDGAAMQLPHYGAYLGWAALELHVIEDVCGARLAHSFGGLVTDPLHRAVVALALDDLRAGDSVGSMIYGNTVEMVRNNPERNRAVIASSVTIDIATQLHRPTGHAIHITPLTEADRIPSAAEIVHVHLLAREIERETRRSADLFNWPRIDRIAAMCASYAFEFRHHALRVLIDSGVNVYDPAAVLLALRQIGPAELYRRVDLEAPAEVAALETWKSGLMSTFVDRIGRSLPRLEGKRVVLAVLEAHDVVRDALAKALPQSGCEVIILPPDSTAASVARAASDEDADAVVIGVYNGSALTLARRLSESLASEDWSGPVIFGGLLNEDEGGALPVDARHRIEALGMYTVDQIEELGPMLAGRLPRRVAMANTPPAAVKLSVAPLLMAPTPETAPSPPPETAPPDDGDAHDGDDQDGDDQDGEGKAEPVDAAVAVDEAIEPVAPAPAAAAIDTRSSPIAGGPPQRRRRRLGRRGVIAIVVVALAAAALIAALIHDSGDGEVTPTSTNAVPTSTLLASSPAGIHPGASGSSDAAPVESAAAPAGATVDAGLGVSVPLPAGWQQVAPQRQAVTISDGTATVSIKVVGRTAGEDPAAPMQEHSSLIDPDFAAVSYTPSLHVGVLNGPVPVEQYSIDYATYDDNPDRNLLGTIYLYQRGDGLTVTYDVSSKEGGHDLPIDAWQAFEATIVKAPALGPAVEMTERPPFRVTSSHPFVEVDGLIGFTGAPGFEVKNSGDGSGAVAKPGYEFDVVKLTSVADADAALTAARNIVEQGFTNISYGQATSGDPDAFGVQPRGVGWVGTSLADGSQWAGGADVFFDPQTGNAIAVMRSWAAPTDTADPDPSASNFMFHSITTSFTTIP